MYIDYMTSNIPIYTEEAAVYRSRELCAKIGSSGKNFDFPYHIRLTSPPEFAFLELASAR